MGGGGSSPSPPKFRPADIPALQQQAGKAARLGYQLSDQDLARRLGPLIPARGYSIADSIAQLQKGALPSQATQALAKTGLVPEGGGITAGGNEFATSRALYGNQGILQKEQRDRNYFENELAANPERGDISGISGAGFLRLSEANAGLQNQLNQNIFATGLQEQNAAVQNQAQLYGAIGSALGTVGSAAIRSAPYWGNQAASGGTTPMTPGAGGSPYTNPFQSGAYQPQFNPTFQTAI